MDIQLFHWNTNCDPIYTGEYLCTIVDVKNPYPHVVLRSYTVGAGWEYASGVVLAWAYMPNPYKETQNDPNP